MGTGLNTEEILASGLPPQLKTFAFYTGKSSLNKTIRARLDELGYKELADWTSAAPRCASAYMRVSKADGSQSTDLQRDALRAAGVATRRLYEDRASGRLDARPGLDAALKALRRGDTLLVWKLDRLGRDLRHLINVVHDLSTRSIGFKVLTGHGASIDTTTSAGKLVFDIFASLAEFERELISERTKAGLASARARGRKGGAPFKMTAAKVRLAMAAMGQKETKVADLCNELGVTRQTLYRHVAPNGTLRKDGLRVVDGGKSRNPPQKEAVTAPYPGSIVLNGI